MNDETSKPRLIPILVVGVLILAAVYLVLNIVRLGGTERQIDDSIDAASEQLAREGATDEAPAGPGIQGDQSVQLDASAALMQIDDSIQGVRTDINLIRRDVRSEQEQLQEQIRRLESELKRVESDLSASDQRITTIVTERLDENARSERQGNIGSDLESSGLTSNGTELVFEDSEAASGDAQVPQNQSGFRLLGVTGGRNTSIIDPDEGSDSIIGGEEEETIALSIPAASYVDGVTLYGINCPIVGNLGAAISGGDNSAVEVVIPLRSTIRGPNGREIDEIGSANLIATCRGRRTSERNYGRAVLVPTKISFVDVNGDEHFKDISAGEVIDTVDETAGIRGPIDKANSGRFAARAAIAALSTASYGLSAQNQILTKTDGDQVSQEFVGNPLEDMAAQGIGGYFQDLQSGYQQVLASAQDTVQVPSNKRIRVVINEPIEFTIRKPKDEFYEGEGFSFM